MVAQANLWDNPEFMEWFNARPEKIRALIRQCPPDQEYRVQGGAFPGRIYSYDEEEGGGVSMKVNIESPFFPRTVFGLKPEHLEPWVDDPANKDKLAAKARERWADRGRTPQHVLDRNKADAWFYRKRNKDKIKEQRWWRERKKVLTPEQKERRREINRAAQARYYERHKDEILKAAKVRRAEDRAAREAEFARRQSRVAAGIRRAAQLAMEKREARVRSIEAIKAAGMRGFNRLADAMAEAHNEIWG